MKSKQLLVMCAAGLTVTVIFFGIILTYAPSLKTSRTQKTMAMEMIEQQQDRDGAIRAARPAISLLSGVNVMAYDFLLVATAFTSVNAIIFAASLRLIAKARRTLEAESVEKENL